MPGLDPGIHSVTLVETPASEQAEHNRSKK
jgi:hypothetical protein